MPTRRDVLLGLAGGAGLLALDACGASGSASGPSSGSSPASSSAVAPSTSATAPPDWEALRSKLSGTLRLPSDSGFTATAQLFDRRFDAVTPAAVASVSSAADVAACVAFATSSGVPLAMRSGGHSYAGGSVGTGLVVDLRPLSTVSVSGTTATIGAGAQLVDVYTKLDAAGRGLPAGSCPTVGIGGLALGGGQGVLSRSFGLTCDQLVSAQVVLADGRTVTASASSEPDLFWALRGGGGSFGAVTSYTVKTVAAQGLSTSYHAFSWAAAADVLASWTSWVRQLDRSVWSTCHLLAQADDKSLPPSVSVSCVRVGSSSGLESALAPFLAAIGSAPTSASYKDRTFLDTMLLEAGCSGESETACHIGGQSPGGTLDRDAFVAGSAFFTAPLSNAACAGVVAAVQQRQSTAGLGVGGVAYDSWGGATSDVGASDTAFAHRDAVYGAQVTASWGTTPGNAPLTANQASLASMLAATRVGAGSGAYANYADTSLADAPTAYWGANLPRLQQVKKAYDPGNLFAPPQGIVPA